MFSFLKISPVAGVVGQYTRRTRLGQSGLARCRYLSETIDVDAYEKEFHLERQLSKPTVTPSEQKQWEAVAKDFKKKWKKSLLYADAEQRWPLHSVPMFEKEGLQKIHQTSYSSNVLLEIRDVRVPASAHHPSYTRLAKHRKHLICYTHADMIDELTRNKVIKWTEKSWPDCKYMFCDTREMRADPDAYKLLRDWVLTETEKAGGINCARKDSRL